MFCWLRQWRMSSAMDDGRAISPRLAQHAARCRQCGIFLDGSRRLGEALAGDSIRARQGPWPRAARPMGTVARRRWLPVAAAAVVLVAVGWWWIRSRDEQSPSPQPIVQAPPSSEGDSGQVVFAPYLYPLEWVGPSLSAMEQASVAPMEEELEDLTRRAQDAAGTLLSYVPRR